MPFLPQCNYLNGTYLWAGRWWGCFIHAADCWSQECVEAPAGNSDFRWHKCWVPGQAYCPQGQPGCHLGKSYTRQLWFVQMNIYINWIPNQQYKAYVIIHGYINTSAIRATSKISLPLFILNSVFWFYFPSSFLLSAMSKVSEIWKLFFPEFTALFLIKQTNIWSKGASARTQPSQPGDLWGQLSWIQLVSLGERNNLTSDKIF